jgi:hypothetical protein
MGAILRPLVHFEQLQTGILFRYQQTQSPVAQVDRASERLLVLKLVFSPSEGAGDAMPGVRIA